MRFLDQGLRHQRVGHVRGREGSGTNAGLSARNFGFQWSYQMHTLVSIVVICALLCDVVCRGCRKWLQKKNQAGKWSADPRDVVNSGYCPRFAFHSCTLIAPLNFKDTCQNPVRGFKVSYPLVPAYVSFRTRVQPIGTTFTYRSSTVVCGVVVAITIRVAMMNSQPMDDKDVILSAQLTNMV